MIPSRKHFGRGLAALLLLSACAAWADSAPPVVVKAPPPREGSSTTLNLQTSSGSSCQAPAVGACGSCSISCPSGQAAFCKAGLATGKQSDASCLQPPECKCQ